MKGASSYNIGVRKLSLILVALICLTLAIWAWEKTPLSTAFLPPSDQLGISLGMLSPVIPVTTHSVNQSVYIHERPSMMEVPSGFSLQEVLLDSSVDKVLLQPATKNNISDATKNNISDATKSEKGLDSPPIGRMGKILSKDTIDGSNLTMFTSDKKECNYAKGKWIADNRRPLYSGLGCKQWLSEMWSCRLNQRTDFSYESFRWQPKDCEMPLFENFEFLRRMQHKTIAFVGDSLGRQQFQSLMCMLTDGMENHKVKDIGRQYGLVKARGAIRPDGWVYRFPETNTTVLYYWSASLCELEPINKTDPTTSFAMHLDRPATFIKKYLHRFDVLVLNTGHHWNRGKINSNRWVMYVNGMPNTDKKIAIVNNAKDYTVHSVAKWIDSQLPKYPRLKVFFRTMSPRHFVNGDWNSGGNCVNTVPLRGGSEVTHDESIDSLTEDAVKGTKIKLLDITALSQLRDEGHVSNYSIRAKPGSYDCLHWCLPGIPDTWNEILAAQV